jgi:transcriptional regulator with XRE-family HTH domain
MNPNDFIQWRKTLGLSQEQAGEALGIKKRMIGYYEAGFRPEGGKSKPVMIPRYIALACELIALRKTGIVR